MNNLIKNYNLKFSIYLEKKPFGNKDIFQKFVKNNY